MSDQTPAPLLNVTLGDYLLTEELGAGGMATVYRAIRQSDGQTVAVKVMSGSLMLSDEFIKRFEREAVLMKSFDHPHILPVYDFGKSGQHTYLAMAIISGGTLRSYIEQHRPSAYQLLPLLKQIAAALDYAHQRGVIHRDLKPSNILMDADGVPYLADFGIAKFREESIGLTMTGMLIGTPGYMAPEQWRSEGVSAQTDVYAFGVMIYELMSSKMPFAAETPFSLMYRHLDEPPPTLTSLRPDLPPTIDRVIRRAMAKVPEKRYPTVGDVVRALHEALAQEPTRPAVSQAQATIAESLEDHTPTTSQRLPDRIVPSPAGERTYTPVDGILQPPPAGERTYTPVDGILQPPPAGERTYTPVDGILQPPPAGERTYTPVLEIEDDFEELGYNAIDVGARVLLQRAREAAHELQGDARVLASVVVQYVEDLRERAKSSAAASPYRALESYDLADNKLFFGREQAVESMLARSPYARLTILHAESGAGKTSLLRAGLMPRLLAGGFLPIYLAVRRSAPHEAIKSVLLPNPSLAPTLAQGSLRAYLKELVAVAGAGREVFIFIDQFETFLTDVFSDEQRASFISELAECLDDELLPIRFTLAMRTEYFGLLSGFQPAISQPFAHEFLLRALNPEEARRALVLPAQAQGYTFAGGLPQQILHDLDTGGGEVAPPQLQLVGSALIELLPPERQDITQEDYDQAGRAEGVLRGYLERLLGRFPQGQRQTARLVIEGLVRADQTRDVRTLGSLAAELGGLGADTSVLESVIQTLRENRVLRLVEVGAEPAYELVHDYLARQIQLDPAASARKAAQELLERRVGDYARYGSLLTEQELNIIEAQRNALYLDESALGLLAETRTRRQRQKRLQRGLVAAAILGLIGALGVGLLAALRESQNQQERANLSATAQAEIAAERDQALIIDARRLADAALQELLVDPVTSLNLALEAFSPRDRPYVPEAEFALSNAVQRSTERLYLPSERRVNGVLWLEEHKKIFTWSEDGSARFFDAEGGEETQQIVAGAGVAVAAWSPDESRLALGLRDGRLVWWGGDEQTESAAHDGAVLGLRWNAGGDQVLSWGQDGLVILWDTASAAASFRWQVGDQPVLMAVWSPDERYVATLSQEIVIWDAVSGQEHHRLSGHVNRINGVQWSPDGAYLLSFSDDRKAIIWDTVRGANQRELVGHTDRITSAHWNPVGDAILTTGFDGMAILWDTTSGQPIHRLETGSVLDGAVWNADGGQVVLFGESAATLIWAIDSGEVVGKLDASADTVYGAAWNADESALLTYTQSGLVHIWSAMGGRPLLTLRGHTGAVVGATWHGTQVLSASSDGSARVWQVWQNGVLLGAGVAQQFPAAHGTAFRAIWNQDETQIATSYADGTILIWDAISGTPRHTLVGHTDQVRFLAWNPDGTRLLSGAGDGTARVWDGTAALSLLGHSAALTSVSWQEDGDQVLTTSEDGTARIWDAASGALLLSLGAGEAGIWGAAWRPDATQIATAGADGRVIIWDATSGAALQEIIVSAAPVLGVAWSQDATRLLVWGYDTFAHVYHLPSGEESLRLAGHSDWVVNALWNPEETRLVTTSSDGTARLWDAITGEQLQIYQGHTDNVIRVTWNQDASRLLTASADGTARVWQVATGQELLRLDAEGERIRSISWNADETRILTSGDDGIVRVWYAWHDLESLLQDAQRLRSRPLTAAQRDTYFLAP